MRILILKDKKKASKHSHLCVYFFVWTLSKHLQFLRRRQKTLVLSGAEEGWRLRRVQGSRTGLRDGLHGILGEDKTDGGMALQKNTSLSWHYFPSAQKRRGHPFLRDWNVREYLAWTHPVLPAEDTQTRVREREREEGGQREESRKWLFRLWIPVLTAEGTTRFSVYTNMWQGPKDSIDKGTILWWGKVWLKWDQNQKKGVFYWKSMYIWWKEHHSRKLKVIVKMFSKKGK